MSVYVCVCVTMCVWLRACVHYLNYTHTHSRQENQKGILKYIRYCGVVAREVLGIGCDCASIHMRPCNGSALECLAHCTIEYLLFNEIRIASLMHSRAKSWGVWGITGKRTEHSRRPRGELILTYLILIYLILILIYLILIYLILTYLLYARAGSISKRWKSGWLQV